MALRLKNSSGNFIALDAPSSIASDVTLTLPNTDGDSGQYLQTDGAGALSWQTVSGLPDQPLTAGTAASATGSAVDFTGIPSTVKRITVMFSGVSLNGTNHILVQLGASGSFETTGYTSTSVTTNNAGGSAGISSTSGYIWFSDNASYSNNGLFIISNISSNTWVSMCQGSFSTTHILSGAGTKSLSGTLDRIRVTGSGSNTFDAGTINILYEG